MNTEIKFKKGVLFIRINGILVESKIQKFEEEVIPIILGLNSKYVTINLSNVELIDKKGMNSMIKISNIVDKFNGKVAICEINNKIKENLKKSDVFDYCFRTKNEKTSIGIFKI